jgi:hypothetical protein
MWRIDNRSAALLAALCLAACGGSNPGSMPGAGSPGRRARCRSPQSRVDGDGGDRCGATWSAGGQVCSRLSGTPLCDCRLPSGIRHGRANNEATTASGADGFWRIDKLPWRPAAILLYARGRYRNRAFNIADLIWAQNARARCQLFAAQGYIVVAPNYAGFDTSTLGYHPYLNADQQSKDMIDALSAARQAMPVAGALITRDSGRLFITGYSQGGYVAMATERAMQAAGMTVTAAAPMSGPYALAAFFDAVDRKQVDGGAPVFTTLLITGYQKAYGNIYAATTDVFEPQYAGGIESLLPSLIPRSELYALGKLPQYALFSATPPDPIYADITPATQPASLAAVFALGFGSGNLLTNSYRLSYLLDAGSHPDGGWPTITTGAAASGPQLGLRQALVLNDLRNWAPAAPTLLCGGNGDPIVFWLNTQLIQGYWASRQPAVTSFSVLDIDAPVAAADPYSALKGSFALAKQAVALEAIAQGATDGGQRAVFEAYHATLVAPFCLAAVRAFFSAQ